MANVNPFDDPSVTEATSNTLQSQESAYDDGFWDQSVKKADNDELIDSPPQPSQPIPRPNPQPKAVAKPKPNNQIPVLIGGGDPHMSDKKMNHYALDKREDNLRRKERELTLRKDRLDKLEHEMNLDSQRQDNWPCSKYPITFHSITAEIPAFARPHMRRMYSLVLLSFLTLFWNFCSGLAMYLTSAADGEDLLWAAVYFGTGIFGAWKLWYRQIYYGIRDRKTLKWWAFFFCFAMHIVFSILVLIGIIPGAAGVWQLLNSFKKNAAVGFCVLIAVVFWAVISVASCFYMMRSWKLYRTRGGLEQAQEELRREAAKQAVKQLI